MMITSLNDDKSAQLKNGYGGLGAGIGLAGGGSCEPPAQACRLSSPPSVKINVDSARVPRLKCSYGRAELMQQNSLFHQQHSNNQHLEEAKTGTATTARAPTEAEAALNTSDRLDYVSTSSLTSEPDRIKTIGQCHTKNALSKHPHHKDHQHHYQQQHQHQHRQHQQQQKRTNLVNLVISLVATTAAGRHPRALFSPGAGPNCRPPPKLSPRPSSAVIISSSISILISILLLLSSISESQCNSAPPGFLDAGKAISCEIGQPIIVSDYFPKDFIDEKRLSLCVTCTCQDGVIKCGQLAATPECALPSATKFNRGGGSNRAHSGTNAAGHSEQQTTSINRPGAPFNKYKPANRAQPNGGHLHHHSQPAWVKPNNGKAKTISTSDVSQQQQQPLRNKQVKSSSGGSGSSTPIAQPIGGPKQQQNRAPLGDHFKQLSSGPGSSSGRGFNQWSAAPLVRHQHHHNHHYRSHHDQVDGEEENAGGNDETSGRSTDTKAARRHYRRPTVRPNWDELLASPSLPADDPKHLSNAASALGFETEEFLQLRNEKLQKLAGRTSTTAQTTTPSPTTMTTTAIDEEETTSTDNGGGAGGDESDDLSPTTTTTGDNNPTDSDRESDLMTTMPPINGFTTDNPEQEQSGQSTIKGGDVYEPNEPFNELTESPPFRQQEPSAIETTATTTTQQPPPPPTSQPQPPFFNRGDSNAIDHSAANEIMEQVSQDGMLYIAIGVEAFILLSIFALMIVFYLYREKTTEDDDNQRHNNAEYARSVSQNHLQSPSRSPSIIEKA